MDKYNSKVYGTFVYADSLTYQELLEREEGLKENLDKLFLEFGAKHIDFTPLGDMLMFQCMFEEHDNEKYRELAARCAAFLPEKISARLLFLEKNLDSCNLFWIESLQWQEVRVRLPVTPPKDTPVHHVKPQKADEITEDSGTPAIPESSSLNDDGKQEPTAKVDGAAGGQNAEIKQPDVSPAGKNEGQAIPPNDTGNSEAQ